MSEKWRQWVKDKGWRKWFKRDNLIVLVLGGILLFIIALPDENKNRRTDQAFYGDDSLQGLLGTEETNGQTDSQTARGTITDEEYAAYLEERLTSALSRMADVGAVEVMITLKSSRELVVEKEQPVSRSTTNESDSQGGSRIVAESDMGENTVYRTDGNLSEPYVIKTLAPEIEGVLVVAEGADSGTVNRTIVEIAQTLFGVEAHKVKVVKMRTER